MNELERQMIAVDGATLEVFLGGAGEPVVCHSHAYAPMPPTRPGPGTQRWDAWSWSTRAGLAAPQADRIRVRLPLPSTRKIWRRCGTSWAWSGGYCGASQLAPSSPSSPPCAPQSRSTA